MHDNDDEFSNVDLLPSKREAFSIDDQSAICYLEDEILGSNDRKKVTYGKKGWFMTRWQASLIGISILIMLFVAVHISRSRTSNVENINEPKPCCRFHASHNLPEASSSEITPAALATIFSSRANPTSTTQILNDDMRYLVEPKNYVIYIQPFLETSAGKHNAFTFRGNVSITLNVKQEVKYLVIGVNDLRIVSTYLYEINEATAEEVIHQIEDTIDLNIDSYDVYEGTLNLELYKWLQPGKIYELVIEFNGDVQNLPYGLFKSQFYDEITGQSRWIVGTNLDVPFARTVFPCFDAPTQMATIQLNIARQDNMLVQSSTEYWQSVESGDGWTWILHKKTSPLPIHSLAFAVTNFENESRVTPQTSHFIIWTATKRTKELEYVLNLGPLLLNDIEVHLVMALPVKKINIFGLPQILPKQKAKIGIIYMSEADLIVQEGKTSAAHKQHVGHMLAGHLIEQWIENSITFRWRQDNWIKEALVQFLEYHLLKFVEPSWKTLDQFFVNVQQLEMDKEIADPSRQGKYIRWIPHIEESELQHLYPINETNVFRRSAMDEFQSHQLITESQANPNIYTQLYEKRLVNKGACLIRMIEHIVSPPLFITSIRIFLEKSRGKVVDGEDFWKIMTKETLNISYAGYQLLPKGVSLQTVLEDWIYTKGYPLITVTRNYDKNTITFAQHVKTTLSPYKGLSKRLNLWYIPVSYTTENEKFFTATAPRFWLNKVRSIDIIPLASLKNSNWLLVNPQQTNFYRVYYDMHNWSLLQNAVRKGELPDIVRSQLIDDALFFARKDMLDYNFALDFISNLALYREKEYIVWSTVLRHMNYIRNMLLENVRVAVSHDDDSIRLDVKDSENLQKFKVFMRRLIATPFNDLNSKSSDSSTMKHTDRLLRSDIFLWACAMGISECNTMARSEFDKWKNTNFPDTSTNPIEPDMRYPVLCSIMQIGSTSDYDFLLSQYQNTPETSPDKIIYLKSLYCFKEEKNYREFLASTLYDNYSIDHLHKVSMMWATIPQSFHTSTVPFNFMIDNWSAIKARFSEFKTIMKTIVEAATFNLQKQSELDALNQLRNSNISELPYLDHTFDDAIRNLQDRRKWRAKQMNDFVSWLSKNSECVYDGLNTSNKVPVPVSRKGNEKKLTTIEHDNIYNKSDYASALFSNL
ncbi:aminopeptidase N-like [Planococcus citri]|uniref:aminopeptidase N-like n=1 Tax=Planococcus citri TaxID=170843 RepID=UPI0031F9421A